MSLSVVLLAEGTGDIGENLQRGPDSLIHEDDWGPAHVLFARAIELQRHVPRPAFRFVEPNRTRRATLARGSALKQRQTLRQLINYLPAQRPQLIIVLVDADGDSSVEKALEAHVSDMPGTKIVAVAIQEFEAWLLDLPNAEALKPRAAKELLAQKTVSRETSRVKTPLPDPLPHGGEGER